MRQPAPDSLLDRFLPACDAVRTERRVIHGDLASVWRAVLEADFMRTAEHVTAVRVLFALRSAAERALAALRRRPLPQAPEPESMRLGDLPDRGEWILLDQDAGREIAFGAIGRFWAGETAWREVDAEDFRSFAAPGFAKVGCSFSLTPRGPAETIVTYECRTLATDDSARRAFMRYWRPLSPFIGIVLRAQLRTVEATFEEMPIHG